MRSTSSTLTGRMSCISFQKFHCLAGRRQDNRSKLLLQVNLQFLHIYCRYVYAALMLPWQLQKSKTSKVLKKNVLSFMLSALQYFHMCYILHKNLFKVQLRMQEHTEKAHTHKPSDIFDDRALSSPAPHFGLLRTCLFESSSTTHPYRSLLLKHRSCGGGKWDLGCAFRRTQPLIKVQTQHKTIRSPVSDHRLDRTICRPRWLLVVLGEIVCKYQYVICS